ncbi:MAG: alpha/beta hydrolase [Actinomycetales bacterium]|nr:alpha/beta hydrolase [Actinomycetales bacterium]
MQSVSRAVRFGDAESAVYDVWEPVGQWAGATVALVHGGIWQAAYDRHQLRPLAAALAGEGWHVANVEYARVGMPLGGWPGTGTTLAAALAAVRDDPELPGPLVVVGHSAGAHVAVWAASESRVPDLAGVVSLAGLLDLRGNDAGLLGAAVRSLLGGGPGDVPGSWDDADPIGQRSDAPIILLHGVDDDLVPPDVAWAYADSRRPTDARCRVELVPQCGHFGLIDPAHAAYVRVVAAVRELLAGRPTEPRTPGSG